MNITPEQIYWITRLSSIGNLFSAFAVILFIAGLVSTITYIIAKYGCSEAGFCNKCERYSLKAHFPGLYPLTLLTFAFIFSLGSAFTPSTKDMCAIIVIPKIANNENVQNVGQDIIDLAQDWLRELHPKKQAEQVK